MLQKIRWTLLLVGVVVILIVSFQNSEPVELDLLLFQGEYPLTLLLLATSVASFVFGALTMAWRGRSRAKTTPGKEKPEPAKDEPKTVEPAARKSPLS